MQRNVLIAYLLTFFRYAWFWLGVWIFYYLRITNYAGIGLVEAIQIVTSTMSEVPTGVIADLFGKKQTLIVSFLLQTACTLLIAYSHSTVGLIIAVFVGGIGGAFYSGTIDSLVYDSLKEQQKENTFDKAISRISSISFLAPAACGVIGGFLYVIHPNLPFIVTGIFSTMGIILSFFLIEPHIRESNTISFSKFFRQTKVGFNLLFKNKFISRQTILLFGIGAVSVICFEMLNDFLGVEFGFSPAGLGVLLSVLYIICALASHLTPTIAKYIPYKNYAIIIGFIIAATLLFSPFAKTGGIILGGICLLFLTSSQAMYNNISSVLINQNTESEYRTTTISAFNLLRNIPYVLSAYFLGALADHFSAVKLAFFLGFSLVIFIGAQTFFARKAVINLY